MSDEAEVQRTRTTERVETQTVEETDYYCPLCEQWYDEDAIVIVGIGPTKENEHDAFAYVYEKHDQLCQGCCERLFDYDGYTGIPGEISYELDHWTWREMLSAGVSTAIAVTPIIIGLLVGVSFVVWMFDSLYFPYTESVLSTYSLVAETPFFRYFMYLFGLFLTLWILNHIPLRRF